MNIFPPRAGTVARVAQVTPIFDVVIERDLPDGNWENRRILVGGVAINSSRMADISNAFGEGDLAKIREMRMLRTTEEKSYHKAKMEPIIGSTLVMHQLGYASSFNQPEAYPSDAERLAS